MPTVLRIKMNKTFRVTYFLVAIAFIFTMVSAASAQRVGGFKEISQSDPGAVAAAQFAVGAQARKTDATIELVSVEQAERQVVAGMKYRLCLAITTSGEEDEADVTINVRVVVFYSLKRVYTLSSWVEEDCPE